MSSNYYIGHFLYNQDTDTIYKYELYDPAEFEFYYSHMLKMTVKRSKILHKDIMTEDDRIHYRGRIFDSKAGPVIAVGNWFFKHTTVLDKIKELFNLPAGTKIIIHQHWDIEHNIDFK